ncbi:chlorophyllide reductase [Rhizobium daejeonense]
MSQYLPKLALAAAAASVTLATSSHATPSTSRGQISVAQVLQMLDRSPTDQTARQVLTAYLAGVGEAASAVTSVGGATCRATLSLSADTARRALKTVAARDMAETPATVLIVKDALNRAGCKPQ